MRLSRKIACVWGKLAISLEAFDWAADYDPVEEQRRWVSAIEARLRAIEQQLHAGAEGTRRTEGFGQFYRDGHQTPPGSGR